MIARRLTGNSTRTETRVPCFILYADNVIRDADERVTCALLFPANYWAPIGRVTDVRI